MQMLMAVLVVYLLGVATTILLARILFGNADGATGCLLDFTLVLLALSIMLVLSLGILAPG